jgi:hypothetical protein
MYLVGEPQLLVVMSRRISLPGVLSVALLAFALGWVSGRFSPRFFSKSTPPAPPPPARVILSGLGLGDMLAACKPPTAAMIVHPHTGVGGYEEEDETNLPFHIDVAEWIGPTDVLEVRKTFLEQLRKHYQPRGLICYGPGINPDREGDPNLAQELIRIDTPDGVCGAMATLSIHITGDRCKVKACVMPARRWLIPR